MSPMDFLPFALPDITDREIDAVVAALRSGWITTGPRTREFEQRFSAAAGGGEVVMVNSCTAAMHLALEAIGIQPGDEVIVPTMTFAATAEVVRYLGATPVLVDVLAADHNIDPLAVERAVTSRTRAVIPVHFAGMPCDIDSVTDLGRARGLVVIDDAAHCFPCEYRGRPVGTWADVTAFSFYATKTMTTAEGGAAVTTRPDWAERMRVMSLHGISKDAWKRYSVEGSWYYEIIAPGFKYNMTDIAAALGLVQLERAEEMTDARRRIADQYDSAFAESDTFEVIPRHADRGHSHHLYVLKLRPGALRVGRGEVIERLKQRGVGASVHFIPLHLHPYYRDRFGYRPDSNPIALDLFERSFSLPIYSRMATADVQRVVEAVLDIAREGRR